MKKLKFLLYISFLNFSLGPPFIMDLTDILLLRIWWFLFSFLSQSFYKKYRLLFILLEK